MVVESPELRELYDKLWKWHGVESDKYPHYEVSCPNRVLMIQGRLSCLGNVLIEIRRMMGDNFDPEKMRPLK